MPNNSIRPIHVGEILREEFLKPLGLSVATLAEFLGIVSDHVHDITSGRCGISADTALRLATALDFGWTCKIPMSNNLPKQPILNNLRAITT